MPMLQILQNENGNIAAERSTVDEGFILETISGYVYRFGFHMSR